MVIWLIGLSGAGKSTVGREVYGLLKKQAPNTALVDGDEIREVFRHTGEEAYTLEGRRENARRIQALCRWLDTQDINVVCPILSVFQEHRDQNRSLYSSYFEVYIETDIQALLQRDYKSLYHQALHEGRPNIVGIDLEFVPPQNPDLTIYNGKDLIDPRVAAERILQAARSKAGGQRPHEQ